jgi:hypothetical protein
MKITLCALLVFASVVFAADKSFTGEFANEELTITLKPAGDGYTGEFKMSGRAFPLAAKAAENVLAGKFKSGEESFDFNASLEENILTIKTGETVYKLSRRAAENPLAKKPGSANPLAKSESEKGKLAVTAWKTFKHPTGLTMSYPPDWELRTLPQALQLVPPNAGSNEKGPTEIYFVMADSAQGVTTAEDPRVAAHLDAQWLQFVPFLRRAGEIEKIPAGTAPGILGRWEGTNPDGVKVQAQALTTILKGYGISVLALGDIKLVQSREKELRGIFGSLAAGAGEKDPQVVGAWKFWSYSGSSSGNYGTERSRFMALQADGTAIWKGRTESSASVKGRDSLGNDTFVGGVAGQSGDNNRGTWSAGDAKLFVTWQDGSSSAWSYRLGGTPGNRRLFLQGADQHKPDEWVEAGP